MKEEKKKNKKERTKELTRDKRGRKEKQNKR